MILYLVRHGEYNEKYLTEVGIAHIELAAKGLLNHDVKIKRLISSPKERAFQSAQIIARGLDFSEDKIETSDALLPKADVGLLQTLLDERPTLCVGHLPHLEDFTYEVTAETAKFGTGSAAKINFGYDKLAKLEWIYTPQESCEE